MSRTYSILPFIIGNVFIVALLCSCSVTRRVPDGRYLLTKNIVEEDKDVAKKDRIKSADVERFILPKPNRKFLGTNLYLQLYNAANPDTTRQNWGNRTLRRLGEAPVLLDSTLIYQSAQIIKDVSYNAGFYDTEVTFRVDTTKRKKAAVIYVIEQKEPYRIGEITYDFRDEFLRPIILEDTAKTLIRTGDLLNANMLRAERNRITEQLKNSGYYDFKINNIEFLADSTVGNHVVDLTLIFKQNLSGYTSQGQPIYENNSIYRINQIVVDPDYDPLRIVENRDMDTMSYRGLDILYPRGQKPKVRKKILRQAINLYPNYLYSSKEVNLAYSNIMRLGYYRSASIAFTPVEMPDSLVDNQVSYIGEGSDEVNIETTTEKYLSSKINCIPALRQSYKIELEGTTSSNFNAINATIGYQNRNLFRGVELFDASVRGGYEFIRAQNQKASFEIGGSISLSFPRFITPFNVDPYNKRVNPRTKVELSINSQRRPYYHRTLSSMTWGYSWSNKRKSSFTLRPIDVNLIKLNYLSEDFINSLNNQYLKYSYRDQLVAGISGSFVYNNQGIGSISNGNSLLFRLNWETAGNLINGISRIFSSPVYKSGEKYYEILGIQFAQYFRIDGSLSDRFILGPRTNIAYRFYAGGGLAYGNNKAIPFDRLFYAGGANSMRGWVPRTLGPGNATPEDVRYPSQLGDLKLEVNTEFRFPVWGMLNGALFFDVGNIWFIKRENVDPGGVFHWNRFYRQLGFNTGLGFRFDIGMAVIRFDWGLKLHDPNMVKGERWINKFRLSDTVLNFGVGYPF